MPDKSRRLYRVDDAGMTVDQMRAATLAEVPTASVVLIGLPRLVVDEPLAAA
jgi:hypothetical protein